VKTSSDIARVDAIAEYGVIDSEVDASLDALARLAATLCRVPTAAVNLLDDRRQHQVATTGFEGGMCDIEDSMCAVVLPEVRRVVVPDARSDDRFADNPFVTGELGHVRFYASSPLVTPGGVPIGTLCVFAEDTGDLSGEQGSALDLLARQVVEVLELRRMTHELARSNDQLAQFAGQVSHDLRNPLTALIGQLDLAADALDAADPARVTRAVQSAESAATRMDGMITALLAYARVGGAHPRPVETSPAAVIGTAVIDVGEAVRAAGGAVVVDVDDRLSVVRADPTLLGVLVQNLIANAVKFAAAAGAQPFVEVTAAPVGDLGDGDWTLTVDDNGPGVPVDARERVFGVMQRAAGSDVPGLGLGLATCRRIAQAHGGRITIEDSPLGGARVQVTLPGATSAR